MADFKIPNLCGASVKLNAIQSKFETMMKSSIDGLEVDASALTSTLNTDVTSLVGDIKSMVPELPALPDVNLQGQLTSLSGMTVGSGPHNTLLSDITSKFGSGLTAGGFSLDTLVSSAAAALVGGTDLCSAVPNFTVPAAGGKAVQKAVEVLQAEADSLPEKVSIQLANKNVTEASTKASTTFNKFFRKATETATLPTADEGAYTVATTSTTITSSGDGTKLTGKVTTPKDNPGPKKKNVSESGFSTRPVIDWHFDLKNSVVIDLKHTPAGGYAPRMGGYIDLRDKTADDFPGLMFTEEEFDEGYAMRRIYPVGHINARVDGIQIADEYMLQGKSIVVVPPNLYNYTGQQMSRSILYYIVKYKYNSKFDPNQKSA